MFSHGTVIEFVCDEGFAVTGDYNYLVCEDGEWDSPMQATCVSKGLLANQPVKNVCWVISFICITPQFVTVFLYLQVV